MALIRGALALAGALLLLMGSAIARGIHRPLDAKTAVMGRSGERNLSALV